MIIKGVWLADYIIIDDGPGGGLGCGGLGVKIEIDPGLVVPNPEKSVNGGALEAWADPVTTRTHRWKNSWSGYYAEMLSAAAKTAGMRRLGRRRRPPCRGRHNPEQDRYLPAP